MRRKGRSGGGPWADAQTSVVAIGRTMPASSGATPRISMTLSGSTWNRPCGSGPYGMVSQEQIRRTGGGDSGAVGVLLPAPQRHRQTSPAGQQQHALADSLGLVHFDCSRAMPPTGPRLQARMTRSDRIEQILAIRRHCRNKYSAFPILLTGLRDILHNHFRSGQFMCDTKQPLLYNHIVRTATPHGGT